MDLALLMFPALFVLLFIGVPVAYSLFGVSLVFVLFLDLLSCLASCRPCLPHPPSSLPSLDLDSLGAFLDCSSVIL